MHFHANFVSTSAFGDGEYYQGTFEAEQDTDDPDSPYLLIQRQFEDPGPAGSAFSSPFRSSPGSSVAGFSKG